MNENNKKTFSESSLNNLANVHHVLRRIVVAALTMGNMDFAVITGYRGPEEQDRLYREKKSRVMFPCSKHNLLPAMAVDLQPYIPGRGYSESVEDFIYLAGIINATAAFLGYGGAVRWGGNWDNDGEILTDQKFQDLYHFELRIPTMEN